MAVSTRIFEPPRPPRRWGLWMASALVVAAVAVAAVVQIVDRAGRCGDGVREVAGGECVGVTDGAYAFGNMQQLSARIRDENQKVARSGQRSVAIAYVEAMAGGSADRGPEATRQAVSGAYLAQRALNAERATLPKIRLLLANTGSGDRHWRQVVDQLIAMKDGENLVAVAGFGQSNDRTMSAVRRLRAAGLPMVGATVAADGLSSRTAGFYRVSFPNRDQTAAAAGYLKEQQQKHPGYRVQVIRDGNEKDDYNTSLYEDFSAAARRTGLKVDDEVVPFRSGEGEEATAGNALSLVADKICGDPKPPDVVYFAGRGRELRRFIEAAGEGGRHCPTTVLSGSSALGVYFDTGGDRHRAELATLAERWKHSRLTVYYTAFTHPRISEEVYGTAGNGPFAGFARAYRDEVGGPPSALASGQAMLGHDAVYTIGKAARSAVGVYGTRRVTARMVLAMLEQTNGRSRVRGISGYIAFDPDTGEPVGRPLALVELRRPTDAGEAGDTYRFVAALHADG
ncbi:ABC transporter substrate-binding protein [Streptomyces angustmyceticus]|uniref:ABC transporter substrate-binding protein n=1 Tax=Streptomyces angustmyceticus TaxID=285578 RepID=UPI003802DBB4